MNKIKENPENIKFPATFYFYDKKDSEIKQIKATQKSWNKTAKIINDKMNRHAQIKMLAKNSKVKRYFNTEEQQ